MIQPKISVVTVCYNAVKDIEKTILSVVNQTYPNIEYIIIDGGSKDGTMDVVNRYKDKIDVIVSEPDKGIYDAMNKGIDRATGEWIQFLNAGDLFYSEKSVNDVFAKLGEDKHVDVIYGYQVHRFSYGSFVRKRLPLSDFDKFMPIGHPASFVRSELLKASPFDCKFKIAADYNFFYQLYKSGKVFTPVDVIVSDFESSEGVSSKATFKTIRETAIVNGRYGSIGYLIDVLRLRITGVVKQIIQRVLPNYVECIKEKKRYANSEYVPLKGFEL